MKKAGKVLKAQDAVLNVILAKSSVLILPAPCTAGVEVVCFLPASSTHYFLIMRTKEKKNNA